jgi:hypothetical protein
MTKSIKIENPQQPLVPLEMSETISWIGYVQRPINQRTQVRNVYLDSVRYTNYENVPAVYLWQPTTLTFTDLSSKLHRTTTTSPAKIIIPQDWTYLIFVSYYVSTVEPAWATWEIWLYADWEMWDVATNGWKMTSLKLNFVKNYKKWDEVWFYIENWLTSVLEWYLQITITKLS